MPAGSSKKRARYGESKTRLYGEVKQRNIHGRSKMDRKEPARARSH